MLSTPTLPIAPEARVSPPAAPAGAHAHQHGKLTVLGGPSVSGAPEWYPDIDVLHVGELGDATDALIERLDESIERPGSQERFTTEERLPLEQFPLPAYHLVDLTKYFLIMS